MLIPGDSPSPTPPPGEDRRDRRRDRTRFWSALGLIVLVAAIGRIVYVAVETQPFSGATVYDATYYELQAASIADGRGFFLDPFEQIEHPNRPLGDVLPAADHPPLTALSLVPAALLFDGDPGPEVDDTTRGAMRLTMVLIGLGAVVLIALAAREIAGDGVGLVAGALAAVDPNLWMNDGLLMSETISATLVAGMLLCALRLRHRWTWSHAIALGILGGLLALTRAELALLLPIFVIPIAWRQARETDWQTCCLRIVAVGAIAVVLVAPWVGYNLSRFQEQTLISTNDGYALVAGNCPTAYSGDEIGMVQIFCVPPQEGDQSEWNRDLRDIGFTFLGDHIDQVPAVVLARIGRMWSVFHLGQNFRLNTFEGRPTWASYLGAVFLWVAAAFAVLGGIQVRRRRAGLWILVTPIVLATLTIALWTGGMARYRAPAMPSLLVLAAVGIGRLATRDRQTETVDQTALDPA